MATTLHETAWNDQYRAASTEARRLLHGQHPPVARLNPENRAWLIEQAETLLEALNGPTARHCAHTGHSPRVLHTAAWAPGVLVCPTCLPLLIPDPTEDSTCDRCRRISDRLIAGISAFGPILHSYGLCRSCATDTGFIPRKDPTQ